MSRISLVFVILFALCRSISAQEATTFTVGGLLTDSIERQPLDAANVVISRARDSVFVAGGMSNSRGEFEVGRVPAGQYLLVISYLGYEPIIRPFSLSGAPRTVNLGEIGMAKSDLTLDEVLITARFNPVVIRQDTIEYNTAAFRIQDSDVVEDLLRRLPGVEVNQDGTVTAGGQQISRVFVDGQQFFGDDPRVALRNLPANIVDRVQVVDRRSDQAQFTGIEDDDTERILNLTLRPGNRDGMFGRALAGVGHDMPGSDYRYDANGLISYFSGGTQLAALISHNNTNNLNFTDFMGEVMGSMGGGGMRAGGGAPGGGGQMIMIGGGGAGAGGRMGSGGQQRMISGGGMGGGFGAFFGGGAGISTSTSGGANANYTVNEKLKVGANYFFNVVERETDQTSNRLNFFENQAPLNYDQTQKQNLQSQNHRMNLEIDYTINNRNSILFRPNLNVGSGITSSVYDYETFRAGDVPDWINSGKTVSESENKTFSTSGTVLWRHSFEKQGRTLSVNLNYGWSKNEAWGTNWQDNLSKDNNDNVISNPIDQFFINENHGYNYTARASYVEPVGNNRFLEFSYLYGRRKTYSERETWDMVDWDNNLGFINDELSTLYDNTFINQQYDVRFNTRRDRLTYTVGAGLHPSRIFSEVDNVLTKYPTVFNFAPTINVTYGETRQSQLRFDYRGMTQQPTIQQLQPVLDNTDPLYEFRGNSGLQPAFRHIMNLMYNNFNPENFRTFMTSLMFTTTTKSIINASTYTQDGKQIVEPRNVNGVYNINASIMMNLPIPNSPFSFSNTLSGNFGANKSITNEIENTTHTTGVFETLRLSFRNNWLELGSSYRLGYNRAAYSLETAQTTNYFNHRVGGEMFLNLPLDFIITSNINYTFFKGYDDNLNRDMTMWTADISKRVFKNKQGTIKLSVYDILRQNKTHSRTTTDNYIEDLHTKNTLGRFGMVSFMYRFNSFSGGNQPSSDMPRGGGGGGMPPEGIRRMESGGGGVQIIRMEGGMPPGVR